jgi:hypothetical protein
MESEKLMLKLKMPFRSALCNFNSVGLNGGVVLHCYNCHKHAYTISKVTHARKIFPNF